MAPGDTVETVPVQDARRLLMHGKGLLADPARKATPAAVYKQIERMGFLQIDTINIVERAHNHIMATRFDGFKPRMLDKLRDRDRKLFEHWTHDASLIPASWLPFWRVRFQRYRRGFFDRYPWWKERIGDDPDAVIDHVKSRIAREGPLMSKDFEHDGKTGTWWGWKPQKAALEYLWRVGDLTVTKRINFHKVYDLMENVYDSVHDGDLPDEEAHVDWACREALDRLGVATTGEISQFLNAIKPKPAAGWCKRAEAEGRVVKVLMESADGSKPRVAYAPPDWRTRARRAPDPPSRIRLLSPFDPVIRDRKRLQRLFNFDYRFEAFVPEPKRKYGYYVLPLLEGDRLVGRLDPKFHRDRGELRIRKLWWEPGIKETAARRRALEGAVDRFAQSIGAEKWTLPKRGSKPRA